MIRVAAVANANGTPRRSAFQAMRVALHKRVSKHRACQSVCHAGSIPMPTNRDIGDGFGFNRLDIGQFEIAASFGCSSHWACPPNRARALANLL
jgi:hypothetical protein